MRLNESIVVSAPPKLIWDYIADPDNALHFMSGVTRWEVEGEQRTGLGARYRMLMQVGSAEMGGLIEVVEFSEPLDMAWSSVTGVDQRGRWRLRERRRRPHPGRVSLRLRRRRGRASPATSPSASPRRRSAPPPAPLAAAAQARRSSTSSCATRLPRRRAEREASAAERGDVSRAAASALLAVDRRQQLLLVHLRAALDVELLRVVVELLAGAARRARSSPSACRRADRTRCRSVELRERGPRLALARAFSLLTVRAAISSARLSELALLASRCA